MSVYFCFHSVENKNQLTFVFYSVENYVSLLLRSAQ